MIAASDDGPRESFRLGQVVITRNAMDTLPPDDVHIAFQRHAGGDWGEVGQEDWRSNERALREGARILSSYKTSGGIRFWIITEADRSATTVLLPEDY